jgi:hypothetical protein
MKGFSLTQCKIGCTFGCGFSHKNDCSAHANRKFPGHGGIDINGIPGKSIKDAEVVAVAGGKVCNLFTTCTHNNVNTACKCGGGWGNYVKIKHDDGYYTVYAHLASVKVTNSAAVKEGQVIGTVGRTGSIVTSKSDGGYHLHFEVHNEKDNRVDPLNPTGIIKKNDKGEPVIWLQTALNKGMNAGLAIDGNFGPLTETAVKNFQTKNKLVVDGIFGPKSREKMFQIYKG